MTSSSCRRCRRRKQNRNSPAAGKRPSRICASSPSRNKAGRIQRAAIQRPIFLCWLSFVGEGEPTAPKGASAQVTRTNVFAPKLRRVSQDTASIYPRLRSHYGEDRAEEMRAPVLRVSSASRREVL